MMPRGGRTLFVLVLALPACGAFLGLSGDDDDPVPTGDGDAAFDGSIALDATGTNDAPGAEDAAGDGAKDSGPACPSPPCERFAFVTSKAYSGSIGGLFGADIACNQLANLGNVQLKGRAFIAYLSTTENGPMSAGARLNASGPPFKRLDGTIVASSRAEFMNGPFQAPISIDEKGVAALNGVDVWTGTMIGGSVSGADCTSWTVSDAGTGTYGKSNAVDSTWVNAGTVSCAETRRLYCVEP